jgi:hypothetical protein
MNDPTSTNLRALARHLRAISVRGREFTTALHDMAKYLESMAGDGASH